MSKLSDFLRARKDKIIREVIVLEPRWSHTYGQQDPVEITIETIDFDSLLKEIDEFTESLRSK